MLPKWVEIEWGLDKLRGPAKPEPAPYTVTETENHYVLTDCFGRDRAWLRFEHGFWTVIMYGSFGILSDSEGKPELVRG